MKYALECEVDSQTILPGEITVEHNGRDFVLKHDEGHMLSSIKVTVRVEHPERFYFGFVSGGLVNSIDGELHDSIIRDFQYLESALAFSFQLAKIRWENATRRVIPESNDENMRIANLNITPEFTMAHVPLDKPRFTDLLTNRPILSPLTTIQSFWREGKNEFARFRYINAFFNFYFVIEGLYGGGASQKPKVREKFWSSESFNRAFESGWQQLCIHNAPLAKQLIDTLAKRKRGDNHEALVDWIIDTRGKVHHFWTGDSRPQGTPFSHGEFEDVTTLLFYIATEAINLEVHRLHDEAGKGEPRQ